jgi:restriction system protein
MEYVTQKFENTRSGIAQKDAYSAKMAAQGYRIISEQAEAGHTKGGEQCCLFAACIPCVFLAGRTPGTIVVTYGRDVSACPACGSAVIAGRQCEKCIRLASEGANQAVSKTAEARKSIEKLNTLLPDSIAIDYRFNWKSLRKEFQEPMPQAPPTPKLKSIPILIRLASALPFLGRMMPPLQRYKQKWTEAREQDAQQQMAAFDQYTNELADWHRSKESFDHEQIANAEAKERQYLGKDRSVLVEYWEKVLEKPVYLEQSPCFWKLDYRDTDNRLVIEYALPPISQLPKVEEVKYRPTINILDEIQYSPEKLQKLYSDLLVKTTIIVLFKLFKTDTAGALSSIAINGTVTVIDRATGRHKSPCVVAIEVEKSVFSNINLLMIDPLTCFKGLNGKLSANLIELEPVSPIM